MLGRLQTLGCARTGLTQLATRRHAVIPARGADRHVQVLVEEIVHELLDSLPGGGFKLGPRMRIERDQVDFAGDMGRQLHDPFGILKRIVHEKETGVKVIFCPNLTRKRLIQLNFLFSEFGSKNIHGLLFMRLHTLT